MRTNFACFIKEVEVGFIAAEDEETSQEKLGYLRKICGLTIKKDPCVCSIYREKRHIDISHFQYRLKMIANEARRFKNAKNLAYKLVRKENFDLTGQIFVSQPYMHFVITFDRYVEGLHTVTECLPSTKAALTTDIKDWQRQHSTEEIMKYFHIRCKKGLNKRFPYNQFIPST